MNSRRLCALLTEAIFLSSLVLKMSSVRQPAAENAHSVDSDEKRQALNNNNHHLHRSALGGCCSLSLALNMPHVCLDADKQMRCLL